MGAESFIHEIEAKTAREAFDKLIEQANQACGTEPYNGSINTCSIGDRTLKFDIFNKSNLDAAYEHIKNKDNGFKWDADYVDVGVSHYIITTVSKKAVIVPGISNQPKWKMQYCLYTFDCVCGEQYTSIHFDKKTEADKKAMELALKDSAEYRVKKEYANVNSKSNSAVTEIVRTIKAFKTKPKLKELPNRKCEEVHTYLFYGWASC